MANCTDIPKFPDYVVYEDGKVYNKILKKYLKPQSIPKSEFQGVKLINSKGEEGFKKKHFLIHRLVYGCFVDENILWDDKRKFVIAHKNKNKKDNRLENLEKISYGKSIKEKRDENNTNQKFEKKVFQYDLEGNFIREFNSIQEASDITGESYSGISKACLGNQKSTLKYKWRSEKNKKQLSDEELKKIIEQWRPIPRYPKHFISKNGEICYTKTQKILAATPIDKNTYIRVSINYNGKRQEYVHKLVAETYIPNPENKLQVNHKDGNKHNNNVDNLEWVTAKENSQHACDTGLCPRSKGKKVIQLDPVTFKEIARFDVIEDAGKSVGLTSGERIRRVCNEEKGAGKIAGGYRWIWDDES